MKLLCETCGNTKVQTLEYEVMVVGEMLTYLYTNNNTLSAQFRS